MSEKIIRDPVHDVIAFRTDRPVDRLLFNLVNAAEFQRLRRIRQLGMASLAYPGADHSRYSHSLGVMETARKILDHLGRSFYIDVERQTVCLAAALLHDLGHGPFSHVFERVSGSHHEDVTQQLILDPKTTVNRALAAHDRELPQRVVDLMRCQPRRTFLCDILSSQLDADRLDYLLRDNHMTGSRYGDYDLGWLLHALTIDEKNDRLAVTSKGVSAVEAYLQSRYHMYRNVYFHKVVRSAEGMVKLALQRAKRLAVQERLQWPVRDESVYKALLGQPLRSDEFLEMDDITVMHCFKIWSSADDAILASLCNGLLYRKVYKSIDLSRVADPDRAKAIVTRAEEAIMQAGGDATYEMFDDELAETGYEVPIAGEPDSPSEILIVDAAGNTRDFAQISPLVQALNRQLMFHRLHVVAQYRDVVQNAIKPLLG